MADRMSVVVYVMIGLAASQARADVFNMGGVRGPDGSWTGLASLETVPVGHPGNAGDSRHGGYGAVAYEYRIGRFEVTAGQYCEFLNAVAATDTYMLYNVEMGNDYGCKIRRSGSQGSFVYSVEPEWANRPVNFVSWGDAARFANWLHNGQPTGPQGPGTTETGAYTLNGAMTDEELAAVTRNPDWRWAIPTEDEWYKAAYHMNDGATGNYWEYPTASNNPPVSRLIDPDPGNSATFYDNGLTIGHPYVRTEVGAHENSASAYGTFDQGGNVREWNEALIGPSYRGLRGGAFLNFVNALAAGYRDLYRPSWDYGPVGFRVVQIPEPGCLGVLAFGGAAVLIPLRRRRGSPAA